MMVSVTLVSLTVLLLLFTCCCIEGQDNRHDWSRNIKIGGLFEADQQDQARAFRYAVEKVNGLRDILPNHRLVYHVEDTYKDDSFNTEIKVCRQLQDGVAAIFGPMSRVSAAHVQSICNHMEVPHIQSKIDFMDGRKEGFYSHSINLSPDQQTLGAALKDLVKTFGWTEFTILYEDNKALVTLIEVVRTQLDQEKYNVSTRPLEKADGTYRPLLKELHSKGVSRLIIDCHHTNIRDFLVQAVSLKMAGLYYHYHFTTLDLGLVDLEFIRHTGTNVTAFRLIDPDNPLVEEVTSDWILHDLNRGQPITHDRLTLRTEAALMYDAVHLFAKALQQVPQYVSTTSLSCDRGAVWNFGTSIMNYIRMTEIEGLTGLVSFENGKRTNFTLQLVEVKAKGHEKIGTWSYNSNGNGLSITKDYDETKKETAESLRNKTLRVVTIAEDPYTMLKDDPEGTLTGNDRFHGFCVDLLDMIAKEEGFKYKIHLVKDGQYGAEKADQQGVWTGMVKELMSREADIAVAPLTISYAREQVIDFTKPFMNLGISILFKKPEKKDPSLFSFLSPLSFEIWIYMLAAYILVSFVLFLLARFSPYEKPSLTDPEEESEQLTLANSFWFTTGSLMMQGSELAPKAVSTRMFASIWWLFALILVSSYTANLAAFLTTKRLQPTIGSAEQLAKQTKVKYGSVEGGSTMAFFKNSRIKTYERMWNFMSTTTPSVFVKKTEEGIKRVREGNYAYLLESVMNEYITQRQCDLMMVGGLLDSKGYGIGTPRGSPYRDLLTDAILKLQERQEIRKIYNYWWLEHGVTGNCDSDEGGADTNSLAIANVGGMLVVLIGGLIISFIVAVMEFLYKAYQDDSKDFSGEKTSVFIKMAEQLRFALRCLGPPRRKKRSEDDDTDKDKIHKETDKQSNDNDKPLVHAQT